MLSLLHSLFAKPDSIKSSKQQEACSGMGIEW